MTCLVLHASFQIISATIIIIMRQISLLSPCPRSGSGWGWGRSVSQGTHLRRHHCQAPCILTSLRVSASRGSPWFWCFYRWRRWGSKVNCPGSSANKGAEWELELGLDWPWVISVLHLLNSDWVSSITGTAGTPPLLLRNWQQRWAGGETDVCVIRWHLCCLNSGYQLTSF